MNRVNHELKRRNPPIESRSRKIEDPTYRHYPCPPKRKWKRKEKIPKNDEGK
jgi:hypothetical protein